MRKSVAVVIPAYNEEGCIVELCQRLARVFDEETSYSFVCYLVENGSRDDTWKLVTDAAVQDSRFVGIQLSRNFGADGGMTAGLTYVSEDAVVLMTADLQDPPEFIGPFLREWERGFENVYGIVTERRGTGPVRTFNSKLFYWVLSRLTDDSIPRNASDFRLLDRRAYEALRALPERGRFIRGLSAWVGFSAIGVEVSRPERFAGESKATTAEVFKVASRGIFANSTKPLRLITLSGLFLSVVSLTSIFILALLWIIRGVPFAGFGTLVALSLLVFGILSLMIGIVSEYVGLIYEEVKQRPNFIVRDVLDVRGPRDGSPGGK
jgi:glycosyltransferase involved in cell wall biosynthesis